MHFVCGYDAMPTTASAHFKNEHKHSVIDKHLRGEHNPRNKDIRAQEMSSEALAG